MPSERGRASVHKTWCHSLHSVLVRSAFSARVQCCLAAGHAAEWTQWAFTFKAGNESCLSAKERPRAAGTATGRDFEWSLSLDLPASHSDHSLVEGGLSCAFCFWRWTDQNSPARRTGARNCEVRDQLPPETERAETRSWRVYLYACSSACDSTCVEVFDRTVRLHEEVKNSRNH